MKIGCCAPLSKRCDLARLGFDFIEIQATELLLANSVTHVNRFLTGEENIYNNLSWAKKRAEVVIKQAIENGVKIITFGSGRARMLSGRQMRQEEEQAWRALLTYMDQKAQGVIIALEPLTREETNFINTGAEAARWIREMGLENFGITIDSYHYFKEQSLLDELEPYRELIVHAHISDKSQSMPKAIKGRLRDYVRLVHDLGVDLSLETVPFEVPYAGFVDEVRGSFR